MITYKTGDILNAKENLILQQVNCRGVMGSGLAKQIADKWPLVKKSYQIVCNNAIPYDLLGKIHSVRINKDRYVVNVFGQLNYGRNKNVVYTDYDALRKAFESIALYHPDKTIAIPYKFGCGLANGDWNIVLKLIEEFFKDFDVIIYKL